LIKDAGPTYPVSSVFDANKDKHVYSAEEHPFIFIGGHPRLDSLTNRSSLKINTSDNKRKSNLFRTKKTTFE
jgi:hypothetical protein